LDNFEKTVLYVGRCRSYINLTAIFSDESDNYISPVEPSAGDKVTIKLRTAKGNVDQAFLHVAGPEGSGAREATAIRMEKIESAGTFDFYQASIQAVPPKVSYFFSVEKYARKYYYNKLGVRNEPNPFYHFVVIPDFKTPNWAKGAVMYQIYPDRFYNGNPANDVVTNEYAYLGGAAKKIPDWHMPVQEGDVCNFYGGDLQGIMQKMAYLRDLGIECIYLNPVFVSPSNHKYDIQDYDHVDPHLGEIVFEQGEPLQLSNFRNKHATLYISRTTNKANLEASNQVMAKLINMAHDNGIKVILDGVFNHCGAFNSGWTGKAFTAGKATPTAPTGTRRARTTPTSSGMTPTGQTMTATTRGGALTTIRS
jgi:alpha-glucosidase